MSAQEILMEAARLHQAGRLVEADSAYARALAVNPNHVDALQLAGMLASQTGRHDRAVALIGKAIRLSASRTPAPFHNNIGLAYRGLGQIDSAIAHFRRATALKPAYPEAHANLGAALLAAGDLVEAASACERALSFKRDFDSAHYTLGLIRKDQERLAEAAACFSRAIARRPDYADAFINLGGVLKLQGALDRAEAQYRRAIALRPNDALALFNLGMVLHEQEKLDDAIDCYRRAIASPGAIPEAPIHVNLAMALLSRGDFAAGLPEYEWRWRIQAPPPAPPAPLWRGEDVAGRAILLYAEQGYGDTLQFVRYASLIAKRGAWVVLQVPAPLIRLMESVEGVAQVLADGENPPQVDYRCPLMSLPLACSTTTAAIPASIPYLKADADLAASWRARLNRLPGLKIGLVWAGAPRPFHADAQAIDRKRSIALGRFAHWGAIPGVTLISLQKGEPAAELRTGPPGFAIQDWTEELNDFADTAALIDGLDLVVGVDTSVIHLAGALGRPVWMLNRFDSCWRWLRDRDDSPWYPTMRLFRQSAPGEWAPVIAQARENLAALAAARA
jgi:tetratricopeptide (TPR) repeat protein